MVVGGAGFVARTVKISCTCSATQSRSAYDGRGSRTVAPRRVFGCLLSALKARCMHLYFTALGQLLDWLSSLGAEWDDNSFAGSSSLVIAVD